jgi:hypothetical protein
LAKDKELEVIGRWRKACVRHFYWAATSTHSGNGEVKWAKFASFFSHITNVHKDLPNKIFNRCAHSDVIKLADVRISWTRMDNIVFGLPT